MEVSGNVISLISKAPISGCGHVRCIQGGHALTDSLSVCMLDDGLATMYYFQVRQFRFVNVLELGSALVVFCLLRLGTRLTQIFVTI